MDLDTPRSKRRGRLVASAIRPAALLGLRSAFLALASLRLSGVHVSVRHSGGSVVTDWRTLRRGDRVRVLEPLSGGETGVVTRIEPCKAPDSAWAYVENGGSIEEMLLLIDGHPPRLELLPHA